MLLAVGETPQNRSFLAETLGCVLDGRGHGGVLQILGEALGAARVGLALGDGPHLLAVPDNTLEIFLDLSELQLGGVLHDAQKALFGGIHADYELGLAFLEENGIGH